MWTYHAQNFEITERTPQQVGSKTLARLIQKTPRKSLEIMMVSGVLDVYKAVGDREVKLPTIEQMVSSSNDSMDFIWEWFHCVKMQFIQLLFLLLYDN